MATIRQKGDPHPYDVRDADCIGRPCLRLHPIAVRGATGSGSRATGRFTYECGHRAYHGCPDPRPEADPGLTRQRRAEGMRTDRS